MACLTALLFVVVGMQFLLHDPLNISEQFDVAEGIRDSFYCQELNIGSPEAHDELELV